MLRTGVILCAVVAATAFVTNPNAAPPAFVGKLLVADTKVSGQTTVDMTGDPIQGINSCSADLMVAPVDETSTVSILHNLTLYCKIDKGVDHLPPLTLTAFRMSPKADQEPIAFSLAFDEDEAGHEIVYYLTSMGITLQDLEPGIELQLRFHKKFRTTFTASMYDFGTYAAGYHDVRAVPAYLGVRFHVEIGTDDQVSIFVSRQAPFPVFKLKVEYDRKELLSAYSRDTTPGGTGFSNVFDRSQMKPEGTLTMSVEFSEVRRQHQGTIIIDEKRMISDLMARSDTLKPHEFNTMPGVGINMYTSPQNAVGLRLSFQRPIKNVMLEVLDRLTNIVVLVLEENQLLYTGESSVFEWPAAFAGKSPQQFLEDRANGVEITVHLNDATEAIASKRSTLYTEWIRDNGGDMTKVDLIRNSMDHTCQVIAKNATENAGDGVMWVSVASAILSRDALHAGWTAELFTNSTFLEFVRERQVSSFDQSAIAFALLLILQPQENVGSNNLRFIYEMLAVQSESPIPLLFTEADWEPYKFTELREHEMIRRNHFDMAFDIIKTIVPGLTDSDRTMFLRYVAVVIPQMRSSADDVEVMILPGLSCVRHSFHKANVAIHEGDHHFAAVAKRAIAPGEQLFADYSEYRMLSKHAFFSAHGLWPDVKHDSVALDGHFVSPTIESTINAFLESYNFKDDPETAMQRFVARLKQKKEALAAFPEPPRDSIAWNLWDSETFAVSQLLERFDVVGGEGAL